MEKNQNNNPENKNKCSTVYKKDHICECECLVNPLDNIVSDCICNCEQEFNLFK